MYTIHTLYIVRYCFYTDIPSVIIPHCIIISTKISSNIPQSSHCQILSIAYQNYEFTLARLAYLI